MARVVASSCSRLMPFCDSRAPFPAHSPQFRLPVHQVGEHLGERDEELRVSRHERLPADLSGENGLNNPKYFVSRKLHTLLRCLTYQRLSNIQASAVPFERLAARTAPFWRTTNAEHPYTPLAVHNLKPYNHVQGTHQIERFFRVAAGLDVGKEDIKRYYEFGDPK
jgi:hypothetical protein